MSDHRSMQLSHRFDDPDVNQTLEAFLDIIGGALGKRLVSVVLHGSIVFDDLAPGYGDLDFLAVVDEDLDEELCLCLGRLRRPLRDGRCGVIGPMVEGAFLPRRLLDPANRGHAFWWGTSGERAWEENKLGWFVLEVIRARGILIWGEDVRHEIPPAGREDLRLDLRRACEAAREHARGGGVKSVDWPLTAARCLYWLTEGALSAKSEAADWGWAHARGECRQLLPRAREIRLNPRLAESAEMAQWLDSLTPSRGQAWLEVESALAEAGGGA